MGQEWVAGAALACPWTFRGSRVTNGMKPTIIEDSESDEDAIVKAREDVEDNLQNEKIMKVYIVEDDKWYREFLVYHLELNPDYEITSFENFL